MRQLDANLLSRGAIISIASKGLGRASHFLSVVLLARYLGTSSFGLYALIWTLIRFVSRVATGGADKAILRYAPQTLRERPHLLGSRINAALIVAFCAAGIVIIGLYLSASTLTEVFHAPPSFTVAVQVFGFVLLPLGLLRVLSSASLLSGSALYTAISEDISAPVLFLACISVLVFVQGHLDLKDVAGSVLFGYSTAVLVALLSLRHALPDSFNLQKPATAEIAKYLRFGVAANLGGTLAVYITWIDRLMLGVLSSSSYVGLYESAAQMAVAPAVALGAVTTMTRPLISDAFAESDSDRIHFLYAATTHLLLRAGLPFVVIFLLLPSPLLTNIFGEAYRSAGGALQLLALGQLINVSVGPAGIALNMSGHHNAWLYISGTGLTVAVLLNALLIPPLGILGAALATAVATAFIYATAIYMLKQAADLPVNMVSIWKPHAVPALAAMLLGLLFRHFLSTSSVTSVILLVALIVGSYFLVSLAIGLTNEESAMIKTFKQGRGS